MPHHSHHVSGSEVHRILVIRLHAFGDLLATLPYLNRLRQSYPEVQLDLLTTERIQAIPEQLGIFDRIYGVKGQMNPRLVLLSTLLHAPLLVMQRYQQVVDLQNNRASRYLQYLIGKKPTDTFEQYTPLFAGRRYQMAIERLGLPGEPDFNLPLKDSPSVLDKLQQAGYHPQEQLIVLNPAGFFPSRNWPSSNYAKVIELFSEHYDHPHKFLLLGDERIAEKSRALQAQFPQRVLNLVGQTSQMEAFSALSRVRLVLSEDSGLAHMSWVQGIPLVLLLGSTRADWTAPPYPHVVNLTSSDLACGDCMQPLCQYADNRCLTRYTPEKVVQIMMDLLN